MYSEAILRIPDINPRDPAAVCSSCGRRGTWAVITYANPSAALERYCRRCWPSAHEQSSRAVEKAMRDFIDKEKDWMLRRQTNRSQPETAARAPRASHDVALVARAWHLVA